MATGGSTGGGAKGVRAGRAFVELGVLDKLTPALKAVGAKFAQLGKALFVGGSLGVAAGSSLLGAALPTLQDLSQLNAAAKALGTTAQGASGLFGALESVGGDFKEDLEGITQFLAKVQDAASGKQGESAELFKGLSVSARELMDLPLEEKFYRIHAAIRELPQEDQMGKLSMLGGSDSMKKWLPLLSMSNEELRERSDLFKMTGPELEKATQANQAYQRASATVGMVWKKVAIAVAPAIEWIATKTTEWLSPLKNLSGWWDIQVARFQLGWANLTYNLTDGWLSFKELFVGGWRDAVFIVETLWNELGASLAKIMATAIGETLALLDRAVAGSPKLQVALAVGKIMTGVGGFDKDAELKNIEATRQLRENALNDAKRKADEARAAGNKEELAAAAAMVGAAQARLAELKALQAAGPNEKAADNIRKAAGQLSHVAGFFALSSGFLTQALGARTVSPQVAEQKKTNVILEQINDKLDGAGPLVFA